MRNFEDLAAVVAGADGEQEFLHRLVVIEQPGEKRAGVRIVDEGGDFGFGKTGEGFPAQQRLIEDGFVPERIETIDAWPCVK